MLPQATPSSMIPGIILPSLEADQAEGLRRLFVEDVRRMIALVSCGGLQQGGALLAHLAASLAGMGRRVLMLDEGLSAGHRHEIFAATPVHDLDDVLQGVVDINRAITATPCHVDLIVGGGRVLALTRTGVEVRIGLINAFHRLAGQYDVVLINAGSDPIQTRPSFAWACQDVIVFCPNHPDVVTHAYSQIKLLHQAGERRFHLLFSGSDDVQAQALFRRVATVSRRHLQLMPTCLGALSMLGRLPDDVVDQVLAWPLPAHLAGHFPALMQRLLRGNHARAFVPH